MKNGAAIMVWKPKKKEYVHGYFVHRKNNRLLIQIENKKEWHNQTHVYRFFHGGIRPLAETCEKEPKASPRKACAKTPDSKYNSRKVKENSQLIYDCLSLGFDICSAKLLALDDFRRGANPQKVPNTTKVWLAAGGNPQNVWVPNPNPKVAEAVTAAGGHGFTGTLLELLRTRNLPRWDVVYLDFCGFFSTHSTDMELLFRKNLLAEKALIHVTFCKREGSDTIETKVFPQLHAWCEHGRVMMLYTEHSETMWKGAFLVVK